MSERNVSARRGETATTAARWALGVASVAVVVWAAIASAGSVAQHDSRPGAGSTSVAGGTGVTGEPKAGEHPSPAPGAQDRWTKTRAAPIAGRDLAAGVWTGSVAVVWGGRTGGGPDQKVVADGAAYDPSADAWRRIADAPLAPRREHAAAWTGTEMIVWGGFSAQPAQTMFADGAAYDPSADAWRMLPEAPIAGRKNPSLVWASGRLVVWGGTGLDGALNDGAVYDPAGNSWRAMAAGPLPAAPYAATVHGPSVFIGNGAAAAVYDPRSDTWSELPSPSLGPAGPSYRAVSDGTSVYLTGGCCPPGVDGPVAGVWDPRPQRWRNLQAPRLTGASEQALGGLASGFVVLPLSAQEPPRPAVHNGSNGSWRTPERAPVGARQRAIGVWMDGRMLVWGGFAGSATLADGAVFTPARS